MFYVYILRSQKSQELYIGYTSDLKKRIKEHNSGRSRYTSGHKPYVLAYYEAYSSQKDAKHREESLKLRGRARVHLLKRVEDSLKLK